MPSHETSLETSIKEVLDHVTSMGIHLLPDGVIVWIEPSPNSVRCAEVEEEMRAVLRGEWETIFLRTGTIAFIVTSENIEHSRRSVEMVKSLFNRLDFLCRTRVNLH